MQLVLVMFRSDGDRRSFSVVRSKTVIGRREDCDLRIPVGDVSRKHCRVVITDDGVNVEDLGSSNGTFVNGERIQSTTLKAGDTLGVGPVNFIVQIDGVPGDDDLSSPLAEESPHQGSMASAAGLAGGAIAGGALEEDLLEPELVDDELTPAGEPLAAHDELTLEDDGLELSDAPLEETPADELGLEEVTAADEHAIVATVDDAANTIGSESATLDATPDELGLEGLSTDANLSGEHELTTADELTGEDELTPEVAADTESSPEGESAPGAEVPSAAEPVMTDELSLEDEAPAAPSAAGELAGETGLEEIGLEEISEDEFAAPEAAAVEGDHGETALELEPAEPAAATAPAAEGDWDFVVEEADPAGSHSDFHIELDPHHERPH